MFSNKIKTIGPALVMASLGSLGSSLVAGALFSVPPTTVQVSNSKVFEEPLFATGSPGVGETEALAKALEDYVAQGALEHLGPIEGFLQAFPDSSWKMSLLVNLGLMRRHTGQVTKAMEAWEEAWSAGKDRKDPLGQAFANRALGELLEANAGLGRKDRLEALVRDTEARPLSGLVTEKLSGAKESLAYMTFSPETAYRCGPMALAFLKATTSPLAFADPIIQKMYSTEKGTSLALNAKWAASIGLGLQMAKREPGSALPVPCVLHLRTGHFSAVMFAKNGRYLLQDPFLGDTWVSLETLDQEGSGYALVPIGALGTGWKPVDAAEGSLVWGKGAWGPGRPDDTRPDSVKIATSLVLKPESMIKPAYHADLVSLNLDYPVVAYAPIRGPRMDFTVTYNQREYGQPQVFDYCNLGPKWTFSFLACVKDDTTNPDADVTVCNPGGGGQVFHTNGNGAFLPENNTQATLSRLPQGYLITYPSGRKEYYEIADRAWGLRRVVLTRIQDKFGDTVNLTWDAMLRLAVVTDAAGKATKIGYEAPQDPLKISQVTDPFGRPTRFQYDQTGLLSCIVNPEGHATFFAYGPRPEAVGVSQDFVRSMETLAGRFTFQSGEQLVGPSYRRWLEATGPGGDRERLEAAAGYAYEIPPERLPNVPELDPSYHPLSFRFRESWFWPAGCLDGAKLDYHQARHIRWGHGPGAFSSGIVLSQKDSNGPRHWFVHTGDFWGGVFRGSRSSAFPLAPNGELKPGANIGNLRGTEASDGHLVPLFDGSRSLMTRDIWVDKQDGLSRLERDYDLNGRLVHQTNSHGQEDFFSWNGHSDLSAARLAGNKKPHTFNYDLNHRLVSWQRSDGSTWKGSYTPEGVLKGWVDGKGSLWTLAYDPQGHLQSATHKAKVWSFTFDAMDRLQGVVAPKGVRLDGPRGSRNQPIPKPKVTGGPSFHGQAFFDLERAFQGPRGCEDAFAGLLGGANGPIISRLMAMRENH